MYIRVMSHMHFGFMTIVFEEVAGLRSVMMIIFNNFADTLLSAFTLVLLYNNVLLAYNCVLFGFRSVIA